MIVVTIIDISQRKRIPIITIIVVILLIVAIETVEAVVGEIETRTKERIEMMMIIE